MDARMQGWMQNATTQTMLTVEASISPAPVVVHCTTSYHKTTDKNT